MKKLKTQDATVQIASDISDRDGIGIEIYQSGELVLEIFRDDTKKQGRLFLTEKH